MNEVLVNYCAKPGIGLTRSRPYLKNDQAWIEQKNGAVVRRMIGYARVEGGRRPTNLCTQTAPRENLAIRKDPFELVWPEMSGWLEVEPTPQGVGQFYLLATGSKSARSHEATRQVREIVVAGRIVSHPWV